MVRVFRRTSLDDDETVVLAELDETLELELELGEEDVEYELEEDSGDELEEDATDETVLVLGIAEVVVVAVDELVVLFEESKT